MADDRFVEAARLDRIENKLDKLSEYISNVARIDERVIALESACKEINIRVTLVEKHEAETSLKVKGMVKFGWLVVGAIVPITVGAIAALMFK